MVLISRTNNKVTGSMFFLLGIIGVLYVYYSFNKQSLGFDQYSFFLLKYFNIILGGYWGISCIALGVLYFIGFLTPDYAIVHPYEKAKVNIMNSIFGLPICILFIIGSFEAYKNIDNKIYAILGALFFPIVTMFGIWQIYSGLKILKKRKKR